MNILARDVFTGHVPFLIPRWQCLKHWSIENVL